MIVSLKSRMENSIIQELNAEVDRIIGNKLLLEKFRKRYEHVDKLFIKWQSENSIFRYKRPKRAVGALHFYTSSERIAREASCIESYFSLQIHANPSWLTVYRYQKCAVTQIHSTAVNTTIST